MAKENKAATNGNKMFDIAEYSKKAIEALNKMAANQLPGQLATGGKVDVLRAIKEDIKALIDKGYTAQQISDALKVDVFSILPKSITQMVQPSKRPASPRKTPTATATPPKQPPASKNEQDKKKAEVQATNNGANTMPAKTGEQPVTDQSTFAVKPDTPNGEL